MNISWRLIQPNLAEIKWPNAISVDILEEQITLKNALLEQNRMIIYEIRMGYHTLSILFAKEMKGSELNSIIDSLQITNLSLCPYNPKKWLVPVCYHTSLAQDLGKFCVSKGLDLEDLIHMHTSQEYKLHFYGFLPGFMYLGGLDKRLHFPRKSNPDIYVPAGSVGIGGEQTGIYPMPSPGGWHIIGRSPLKFFDLRFNPPVIPDQGDYIIFESVSVSDYELIAKEVSEGQYIWKNA
ncbi:allophanate hydrolase subunit 1 [Belliella kenyensis]|uniref:Allophanate hydrolase subunit 1 n=1 Tax=Belliella kenyensis TaxID=1472724 RepID=A0ABV8EL48_9BACT|nr:allophanate hydrolase subunit 1 [Belliella kenyensis]MCH7400380.1 allophanate hydrolase subunit 1 [Belliella kenyensis]MDN3604602.1 allophanate hydrolase subunit 1 [Belliella kenyensis]